MDEIKQIVDRLQTANSVLVTVNSNPTVDQLAACIGLTIALNKLDKHATAVFSGDVPDTLEFLRPGETIERNTDSLRDFIIALDKSKADKLRYKLEDKVVKIFITPYRTSINETDLNFSQGDLNVDVVVALGVHEQKELDQAVTAHGRILHDATVITISSTGRSELGSINWQDEHASSLSEMVTVLAKRLDKKIFDEQIATALLTGVVAATDRFRNAQTSAQTMNVSADLMAGGANQQLVTSKLDHSFDVQQPQQAQAFEATPADDTTQNDGSTMSIAHEAAQELPDQATPPQNGFDLPQPPAQGPAGPPPPSAIVQPTAPSFNEGPSQDDGPFPEIHGVHAHPEEKKEPEPFHLPGDEHHVLGEPGPAAFGSSASGNNGEDDNAFDPLSSTAPSANAANQQLLSHDQSQQSQPDQAANMPDQPAFPQQASDSSAGAFDVPSRGPSFAPVQDTPSDESPQPASEPPKPDFSSEPAPDSSVSSVPPVEMSPGPSPEPPSPSPEPNPFASSNPQPAGPPPFQATPAPPQAASPEQVPPDNMPDSTPAESSVSSGNIDVDAARDEVMRALSEQSDANPEPIEALNAQPLGEPLHNQPQQPMPDQAAQQPQPSFGQTPVSDQPPAAHSPADRPMDMPMPAAGQAPQAPPPSPQPTTTPQAGAAAPPPPGPPPMTPPAWPGQQ